MIHYIIRPYFRFGLISLLLFIPRLVFSQTVNGKVLSAKTYSGIAYVNVGVKGKNIGTVSDESGNFTLNVDKISDNDSLRFSMIGYEPKTFRSDHFLKDSVIIVYLTPKLYDLEEVRVIYHKPRITTIGYQVTSGLSSGFGYNFLGSEFGIKVNVKRSARLIDLNLNVATCTFDTVTYRLNIYQSVNQNEYKNILREPIYLTFTKDKINKAVTFDLSKYSVIVEGNVIIALELFKDLGDGKLFFYTSPATGSIYHRKAIEGSWAIASGSIGMYLRGQLIK